MSEDNKPLPTDATESAAPVEATASPAVPVVTPTAIPLRWVRVTHHSPDHIATRYPYAAYGSNLSLAQMVRRCPTSDIHGHGMLRNAKVVFAYYMGIVEAEGASVPVGVYKMTAADVAAMDRAEGLSHGGRNGYERFLVTVEMNGEAVRCFTYVKRDNDLEEPTERYYQTCLAGYGEWNFDTRRLRHARDDARKNGKKRTYSGGYGFWRGEDTRFDWEKYRSGSRNNATTTTTGTSLSPVTHANGAQDYGGTHVRMPDGKWLRKTDPRAAMIPTVRTYDETRDVPDYGNMEPLGATGSERPTDKSEPRISLVTGRDLNAKGRAANFNRKHGSGRYAPIDPTRISTLNGDGQEEFVNPKNGEKWRKGANGVWFRAKE